MSRISIVVSLIVVALATGCSSPTAEPTYYLLRGEASGKSGAVKARVRVGLGRILVAPYLLSSPGLVVETGPGQIRAARQHLWAEPLDSGLRWFLRGEIARAIGYDIGGGLTDRPDWDYSIDVYIATLHGTMSGTALLQGAFVIRPLAAKEPLRDHLFSRTLPLGDEGYAALAATEQRLIVEFAQAIAAALRQMGPDDAE